MMLPVANRAGAERKPKAVSITRRETMRRLLFGAIVSALSLPGTGLAQAPAPRFEAASIKRNTTDDFVPGTPRFAGETFTARQMPVATIISTAYGIPTRELVDGPDWIYSTSTERFDVLAKAAPGSSRTDMQAMLRHMLEDRFKLRLRRARRDMPVYLLTRIDPAGSLGPNLRRPTRDCSPKCTGSVGASGARGEGMDWALVLQSITNAIPDRRVIDQTGLTGAFDFELAYRRGLSADPNDPQADIFTAVRQQLGLKLEPGRMPFDVGVIERIERPTPD